MSLTLAMLKPSPSPSTAQHSLKLKGILLTHHHWGHSNGAAELSARHQILMYILKPERIEEALTNWGIKSGSSLTTPSSSPY